MAVSILNGINIGAPGTYVFNQPSDVRPIDPRTFKTLYLLGSSPTGVKNTPTIVFSPTDFTNKFSAASPSKPSIDLFFANNGGYGQVFFVNVAIATTYNVQIVENAPGSGVVGAGDFKITVNGKEFTYTATANQSINAVATALKTAINADSIIKNEAIASDATGGLYTLKSVKPTDSLTVSTSTASKVTITSATPGSPEVYDYVYAIKNVFSPTLEAGFVACPEAFMNFNQSGRTSVAGAMEILASGGRYQWSGIIDCGLISEITNVTRAYIEAENYPSPQGFLSYYFPHLIDIEDRTVPPSAGIAAIAIRRYIEQGYAEPPAGVLYALKGVKDVHYNANWNEQDLANPKGVNLILKTENKGIICWGARTRSTDLLFQYVNTRVILNITINTLRRGFDEIIMSSIGGTGDKLFDLQRKATALLDLLWREGLFYGSSPQSAYSVYCDPSVQTPILLQQAIVNMYIWVTPATFVERLIINLKNVAIGDLEVQVAADLAVLQQIQASTTADSAQAA